MSALSKNSSTRPGDRSLAVVSKQSSLHRTRLRTAVGVKTSIVKSCICHHAYGWHFCGHKCQTPGCNCMRADMEKIQVVLWGTTLDHRWRHGSQDPQGQTNESELL